MSVPEEIRRILCKKTVAFHTLGCRVNAYETDAMAEEMKKAGAEIVPFTEKADIYIINTCSVTNIADRKSRQMLNRAKKLNPEALIVATGCYAQLMSDRGTMDHVPADLVLGNNDKDRATSVIASFLENGTAPQVLKIREEKTFCELTLERPKEHTRAYLKVQDGCDQFCSYCIIPFGRGTVRSRREEDVLQEAERLSGNGIREFVLTGIHLSSYGLPEGMTYNRYMKEHEVQEPLILLIEALNRSPSVGRLRLSSLEPRLMTEAFVKRLSACEKVCPQFHLSLQSGCDRTLVRMNRHYTKEEYAESVRILRKYYALPALTTDVIAGFPGETDEDFEASFDFIQSIAFYELHVFPYSRRKGTAADLMPDQVPDDVKKARADRLLKLSEELKSSFEEKMEGRLCEVLTEETEKKEGVTGGTGYTREYVRAFVPGIISSNVLVSGIYKGGCVL